MFDLNPLNNPDAFWQHMLMVFGAIVIGYIIGYSASMKKRRSLEKKLIKLNSDVDNCYQAKHPIEQSIHRSAASPVPMPVKEDLKIIEGIGPVLEEVLNSEGIYNFAQLASATPDYLTDVLKKSDRKFQIHDPRTWPQQAMLAQNGMWNELKE
ncbi:MAG TPA: hypothetical protein VGN64_09540, partial [Dyadobacter sp.]|nr:hypothetical protein [Dyadobacter sp.]